MACDRMGESFREDNWFLVALASQSLENILSETAIRINCSLGSIDRIHIAHLVQPFFVSVRRCFAERTISRGISERKIEKSGQRSQRLPSIKTHCGVRIGHAINEVGIKPVVVCNFLRTLPAHAP